MKKIVRFFVIIVFAITVIALSSCRIFKVSDSNDKVEDGGENVVFSPQVDELNVIVSTDKG